MMWPFRRKSVAPPAPAEQLLYFLSPLDIGEVNALGLPSEAVVGQYADGSCSLESFRPNPVFVAFLHRVIGNQASESHEMAAAAKEMHTGYLYVLDWRTPDPQGTVPPEDIIGAIEVRDGRLVAGSYAPNPNYSVLTAAGMTRLTPFQRAAFVKALPRRSADGG